ncbi:hypothetical protein Q3G72_002516 [Acer saccharum]|nr:hypothetical protein Q3G72_002516 [Acer saccharum]
MDEIPNHLRPKKLSTVCRLPPATIQSLRSPKAYVFRHRDCQFVAVSSSLICFQGFKVLSKKKKIGI